MNTYLVQVGRNTAPTKIHASRAAVAVKIALDGMPLKKGESATITVTNAGPMKKEWNVSAGVPEARPNIYGETYQAVTRKCLKTGFKTKNEAEAYAHQIATDHPDYQSVSVNSYNTEV